MTRIRGFLINGRPVDPNQRQVNQEVRTAIAVSTAATIRQAQEVGERTRRSLDSMTDQQMRRTSRVSGYTK